MIPEQPGDDDKEKNRCSIFFDIIQARIISRVNTTLYNNTIAHFSSNQEEEENISRTNQDSSILHTKETNSPPTI